MSSAVSKARRIIKTKLDDIYATTFYITQKKKRSDLENPFDSLRSLEDILAKVESSKKRALTKG